MKGETSFVSSASWAPGRPLATTLMRRSLPLSVCWVCAGRGLHRNPLVRSSPLLPPCLSPPAFCPCPSLGRPMLKESPVRRVLDWDSTDLAISTTHGKANLHMSGKFTHLGDWNVADADLWFSHQWLLKLLCHARARESNVTGSTILANGDSCKTAGFNSSTSPSHLVSISHKRHGRKLLGCANCMIVGYCRCMNIGTSLRLPCRHFSGLNLQRHCGPLNTAKTRSCQHTSVGPSTSRSPARVFEQRGSESSLRSNGQQTRDSRDKNASRRRSQL